MLIGIDASRAFIDEPTGTETYSSQLIKSLAIIDQNNEYRLYCKSKPEVDLPDNFSIANINIARLWTQIGLALECLKNPPDLLFIPAHTLPLIRRFSLKTVVTIHDIGTEFLPQYHTYPSKLYLNISTIYAVKMATRIIAVSKATKNDLVNKLGANENKIDVVYEGYDNKHFKFFPSKKRSVALLKKYQIRENYLLFVGTIQPRKNLERLIEAFSNVLKNKNLKSDNLQLILVGKKGWMYEAILNRPKQLGVENQVKFLEYVDYDDLPIFYSNAKAFVLPSLMEGFGLPALEAMACGTPVVVSNCSSLPEVVGDAGLLVNPDSVSDIQNGIEKVLASQDLRHKMINKGLAQAQKFSWANTAKETLKVFEKGLQR